MHQQIGVPSLLFACMLDGLRVYAVHIGKTQCVLSVIEFTIFVEMCPP
jgi:hypothetical protein